MLGHEIGKCFDDSIIDLFVLFVFEDLGKVYMS